MFENDNDKYMKQGTMSKIKGEIKVGILMYIFSRISGGIFLLIFGTIWIPIIWLVERHYLSTLQPTDGDMEVAQFNNVKATQQAEKTEIEKENERIYREKYNETLRRMKGDVRE